MVLRASVADAHRSLWLAGHVEALGYFNLRKVLRFAQVLKLGIPS